MGEEGNGGCPRCATEQEDFHHMLWRRPKLFHYWSRIFGKMKEMAGGSNPLVPQDWGFFP